MIVLGGKGAAVVVAEQILDAQLKGADIELLGLAFDDPAFGSSINGIDIVSKTREAWGKFERDPGVQFIFQLYRPDLMQERIALNDSYGIPLDRYCTFVHPSVMVARSARLGYGTSIMANSVVNPGAVIGNHCSVHSGGLVGHDTHMGNNNFLAAHVAMGSNCRIGHGNFFGLNSSFNNYLNIGDGCFVAMASNVIKDIPDGIRVLGNPAKPFNRPVKPL